MTSFTRHILIPAIIPVLFFGVAATPVEWLGCSTRGLVAIIIAFIGVLAGLAAAIMALRGRLRGEKQSIWWVATALVLSIPAIAVLFLSYGW